MITKTIKRPWIKNHSQGKRYNPDPFYHTQLWKGTKSSFTDSSPLIQLPKIGSFSYKNMYCVECWREGIIKEHDMTDHIVPIKQGGSRTDFANLQNMCNHHHAVKSANEANAARA